METKEKKQKTSKTGKSITKHISDNAVKRMSKFGEAMEKYRGYVEVVDMKAVLK